MRAAVLPFERRARETFRNRNAPPPPTHSTAPAAATPALGNKLQVLAITNPYAMRVIEKLVDLVDAQPARATFVLGVMEKWSRRLQEEGA